MKRTNVFYIAKRKRVEDLTKEMETIEVEHQRNKLKKIIAERKDKWR
jgi:hypothetical protein